MNTVLRSDLNLINRILDLIRERDTEVTVFFLLFKGEKNNGFDVLYHNMKHGVIASKELAEFLRERSAIEENNYKLLSKVAKQASNSTQGTFAPVWAALRGAAEKLAVLHFQMAQRVSELIKDVSKYADELHKKHKAVRNCVLIYNSLADCIFLFKKISIVFSLICFYKVRYGGILYSRLPCFATKYIRYVSHKLSVSAHSWVTRFSSSDNQVGNVCPIYQSALTNITNRTCTSN